jgi:hypothetical protein
MMNCCDSLLNEFSCRFCLGDAPQGTLISNYFRVEKRIITSAEVLRLISLKVVSSPLVPNRICQECHNTIVNFYSLKKNFQDNEAVLLGSSALLGKVEEDSNPSGEDEGQNQPSGENILPAVKEFIQENPGKTFSIKKQTGKLTIECRE